MVNVMSRLDFSGLGQRKIHRGSSREEPVDQRVGVEEKRREKEKSLIDVGLAGLVY